MTADLDRVLLEIKDLRADLASSLKDGDEPRAALEVIADAVRRTAYDLGQPCPLTHVAGEIHVDGIVRALIEMALTCQRKPEAPR